MGNKFWKTAYELPKLKNLSLVSVFSTWNQQGGENFAFAIGIYANGLNILVTEEPQKMIKKEIKSGWKVFDDKNFKKRIKKGSDTYFIGTNRDFDKEKFSKKLEGKIKESRVKGILNLKILKNLPSELGGWSLTLVHGRSEFLIVDYMKKMKVISLTIKEHEEKGFEKIGNYYIKIKSEEDTESFINSLKEELR